MLLIYTGEGKGKTTAAVGQTIRALGAGLSVAFGQFMKRDEQAGEQILLKELLGDDFLAGGLGFFRREEQFEAHRQAAREVLAWALERLEDGVEVLVLDEALYALGAGLVERAELELILDAAAEHSITLVLTGRGLPDWLEERAQLITDMHPRKHPYTQGVPAAKGIEF